MENFKTGGFVDCIHVSTVDQVRKHLIATATVKKAGDDTLYSSTYTLSEARKADRVKSEELWRDTPYKVIRRIAIRRALEKALPGAWVIMNTEEVKHIQHKDITHTNNKLEPFPTEVRI